jgi:hypothetical protein
LVVVDLKIGALPLSAAAPAAAIPATSLSSTTCGSHPSLFHDRSVPFCQGRFILDLSISGRAESLGLAFTEALTQLTERLPKPWIFSDRPTGKGLVWRYFLWRPEELPEQGWKIHVSVAPTELTHLFELVLPILVDQLVSFKVPGTAQGIAALNFGEGGSTQIGKIVTAYPTTLARAAQVAKLLDDSCPYSLGPEILSDVRLRPGGAISLRYGGFGGGPIVADSIGRLGTALRAQDGSLVEDKRDSTEGPPPWAPRLPFAVYPSSQNDATEELSLADKRFLPLAVLAAGPLSTVTLALEVNACKNVVLKIVRPGFGADLHGFDARLRLINEWEILTTLDTEEGVGPKVIGFHDGDTVILVEQDLAGETLDGLPVSVQIDTLADFANAIARLHSIGFVHRDIKPSNVMLSGSVITLLDFGLASRIDAEDVPLGGTGGYVPPEGAHSTTAARDIYALGVSVAHVLLGHDPASLPRNAGRLVGLLHQYRLHEGAEIVRTLVSPVATRRPPARKAAMLIRQSQAALHASLSCDAEKHFLHGYRTDRRWSRRAATEAGFAVRHFQVSDVSGSYWRNAHFLADFACEGINLGAAGIVIGLASIDRAFRRSWFDSDIRSGAYWLAARNPGQASGGLFTGNAGVAIALAVAGTRLGQVDLIEASRARLTAAVSTTELDLFSGAAGVVLAGCILADVLDEIWPLEVVTDCVNRLVKASYDVEGVVVWPPSSVLDSSADPYTGAAHGSSGIALALAKWGKQAGDRLALTLAEDTFRSLDGGIWTEDEGTILLCASPTSQRAPVLGWCHGVSGFLWCLLNAYGDEPQFTRPIERAVAAVSRPRIFGDATYCHGVSGALELWRILEGDPRFAHVGSRYSRRVIRTIRLLHDRVNGAAIWCSDDPRVVTPDLWIGFLAPATAMALYDCGTRDALLSGSWLRECGERA